MGREELDMILSRVEDVGEFDVMDTANSETGGHFFYLKYSVLIKEASK